MKQGGKFILLLALLVGLVGINFAIRSPSTAAPAAGPTASARSGGPSSSWAFPDSLLALKQPEASERLRAAAARRNIFEYGRAAAPAGAQAGAASTPPPPPPAPPSPLRFYGFAESTQGGKRQVFITNGEDIYVAVEGDVIQRRYRLLRVGKDSIEVEELAGKQRWVVPLEQP